MSAYPTATDLLVYAFGEFKRLYIDDNLTYAVFLRRVFSAKETHEVYYKHFTEVADLLSAEFSRAYYALYENRKKVIEVFTRSGSFSKEAAAQFLHTCEARQRPRPKPKEHIDVGIYERLAEIANRFRIFTVAISGDDLLQFRDGIAGNPLQTANVAKATFFLSLLSVRKLLPHDWKTKTERLGLMVNTRTGEVPTARYLRNVASSYGIKNFLDVTESKSRFFRLDIPQQIALAVRNVIAGRD